jgi:hypothetical protein
MELILPLFCFSCMVLAPIAIMMVTCDEDDDYENI